MKNFGKNVNIKPKQKGLNEKDIFLDMVDLLSECWDRSGQLEEEWGFDVSSYDEPFYLIIENLFYIKYGEWKTDIILWWVYNRFDEEGKLMPVMLNDHIDKIEEEIFIETPIDLWEFLKRIEKLEK